MTKELTAFAAHEADNVATALEASATGGSVQVYGFRREAVTAGEDIPLYHKIALENIPFGANIVKYGVTVGRATRDIPVGSWVHIHCMESLYDARSSKLDPVSGTRKAGEAL